MRGDRVAVVHEALRSCGRSLPGSLAAPGPMGSDALGAHASTSVSRRRSAVGSTPATSATSSTPGASAPSSRRDAALTAAWVEDRDDELGLATAAVVDATIALAAASAAVSRDCMAVPDHLASALAGWLLCYVQADPAALR